MSKFYGAKTEGGIAVWASQALDMSQATATGGHVLALYNGEARIAFQVGEIRQTHVTISISASELAMWLPELVEQLEKRE